MPDTDNQREGNRILSSGSFSIGYEARYACLSTALETPVFSIQRRTDDNLGHSLWDNPTHKPIPHYGHIASLADGSSTSSHCLFRYLSHVVADASVGGLFSNVPVSIAASIILFPLMIEVVQMTMFRRAAYKNTSQSPRPCVKIIGGPSPRSLRHTFFLLR